MNRPRKNGKHLPRRMIESHGSYFLLKPIGFRRNKAIRLGRVRGVEGKTEDELYAQALKRYADLIAEVDAPVGTMVKLLERWKNEALSKYALKTRKEYIRMTDIASKEFAEFDIEHVRSMHISAFVDDNFIDKPNAANKYRALLSLVFSFAVRKGCGMTTLAVIYRACLNRNGRDTLQMRNWLACVLPHCGVMTISRRLAGE